jgi:hypothetical protein
MHRIAFAALIGLLLVPRLAAPQGEPLGPEFQVDTKAPYNKPDSSSIASAGSDFVVVWDGTHADGYGIGGAGVVGLRFDSAGNPLGTEFHVNTYTTGTQGRPAVAAYASGDFVVVWESGEYVCSPPCPPPPGMHLLGQRYAASGAAVGPEFQVNTAAAAYELFPAVAVAPSGDFLVVWYRSTGIAPPGPWNVIARRFDSSGVPLGPEFRVNTTPYTAYWQGFGGSVAADPAGSFLVVWTKDSQGGDVYGQRYAASGAPVGTEFRVNTYTTGLQSRPAVASDLFGNFIVAWDSGSAGVFGQRFESTGSPLGPEFRTNSYTTGLHSDPAIAVDGGGNFVITWVDSPPGPPYTGDVFGQRYSSAGVPSGQQFRVNTTTSGWQRTPSVASNPGGIFVVTWSSGPDNFVADHVFGQRFGGVFPVELQDFRLK